MSVEPLRQRRVTGDGGGHGARISALERKVADMKTSLTTVETSLTKVQSDTSDILAILSYTKSFSGYVRKYGGRVLTFVLGYLVLSGKMSNETGQLFRNLLGIG